MAAEGLAPRLAAVGAGRMGRGIAVAFAYVGHRIALVVLRLRDGAALEQLRDEAFAEIRTHQQALARLGALGDDQVDALCACVSFVPASGAATPLVPRPQRFLNMHWLNPAYLIPVVELSTHAATAGDVLERTRAWMASIGKLPVLCRPAPGYIVPQLQALVTNEAARMVEEGVAMAEEIDKATRFGIGLRFAALGVVEFIDFGGVDILHHASRKKGASIDAARYAAPAIVGRMIAQGHHGLKTASGFYDYTRRDLVAYRHDALARAGAVAPGRVVARAGRPDVGLIGLGVRRRLTACAQRDSGTALGR